MTTTWKAACEDGTDVEVTTAEVRIAREWMRWMIDVMGDSFDHPDGGASLDFLCASADSSDEDIAMAIAHHRKSRREATRAYFREHFPESAGAASTPTTWTPSTEAGGVFTREVFNAALAHERDRQENPPPDPPQIVSPQEYARRMKDGDR